MEGGRVNRFLAMTATTEVGMVEMGNVAVMQMAMILPLITTGNLMVQSRLQERSGIFVSNTDTNL
jgi:hypothetical protein